MQFPKFLAIIGNRHGEVKSEVEFFTGRFCTCALKVAKMAQNLAKTQVMYENGHG